ncbi:hypothetical protein [Clostridium sp. HBUAS56017]|uniref:hypothetical protein n=1 Tax=Clostridium sp. HBUAS56017 TaxID=2571128 RepID=UPI001178251A|nr:hypothetical protein [Clostridium sp. HBUAS56017]
MKKLNAIKYLLLVLSVFLIGCSDNTGKDTQKKENSIMRLNVIEASDTGITAAEENKIDLKYNIPNSQIEITDTNDNSLSWNELKNAKVIEVHYSGSILERYPAVFEKIIKVVIIS